MNLIGLTIAEAERRLEALGLRFQVRRTLSPRAFSGEEWRVVRVTGDDEPMELVVAAFCKMEEPGR